MVIDQSTERQLKNLRIWNIVVGIILAIQAVMIAVLTNSFSLPVTATFISGPPGTTPSLPASDSSSDSHTSAEATVGRDPFIYKAAPVSAQLLANRFLGPRPAPHFVRAAASSALHALHQCPAPRSPLVHTSRP